MCTMTTHSAWPPRIQIAGVSSLEEAFFCHSAGVDALGFTLELPTGIHDGLTVDKAHTIVSQLPDLMLPVLITYLDNALQACSLAIQIGAGAVQFHGGISPEQIQLFKKICSHIPAIACVSVTGPESIQQASLFTPPLWDAVILDSINLLTGRRGATGMTHDWSVSATIVKASVLPVILAGGLTPNNVAEAIVRVRPHGVDTHSGVENQDGSRSFTKIRAFAAEAIEAFASLHRA